MTDFRCAAVSAALDEPLAGTASVVGSFLLVQQSGPWGPKAPQDSRMATDVATRLSRLCADAGVRPLLIRRHGRAQPPGVRVFAAHVDPVMPWVETAVLDDIKETLELDLQRLRRGESVGLVPWTDPVVCVCTHGSHDICCAEQGRPLAAALAASHPDQTWESSHIGGDRFAGNMLILPHGFYYGRADRGSGPRIVATHLDGRIDLDHFRGRTSLGFAAQAAEWHLRHHLNLTGIDDVQWVSQHAEAGRVEVHLVTTDSGWVVRLQTMRGAPRRVTCGKLTPGRTLQIQLESIARD